MAFSGHGFENIEPQTPSRERVPRLEQEEKILEIVQASTPEEIIETLNAGADMVVCEDFETRMVEDDILGGTYADHSKPLRVIYLAALPDRVNQLIASGHFEANWEIDAKSFAPYLCLKSRDKETFNSVFTKLNNVFGKGARLDQAGNYTWNKKIDKDLGYPPIN